MFKHHNNIIIMSGRGVEVLTTFGRESRCLNVNLTKQNSNYCLK